MRTGAVLAITLVEIRRFLADRSNIFFAFVFPLVLVLVLGIQNSGDQPAGRVAVVGDDSSLQAALVDALAGSDLEVEETDAETMRADVAQGRRQVGVLVSPEAARAFDDGDAVELEIVTGGQTAALAVAQVVRTAAATAMLRGGQETVLAGTGATEQEVDEALAGADERIAPASLAVQDTSEVAQEFSNVTGIQLVAGSMLLLFTFLNTLAGGAATLIQARRDGIVRRTLAAPVTAGQAITGIALGRLAIAGFQAVYIVVATRLLFGVDWGDIAAVTVLLLLFGLVGAGLSMILGTAFDNEGTATGLAVGLGLVLGALGGTMFPLEFFPDTLRRVAHITPHAWGYEAIAQIQRHGAGVLDILPQLGVLAGMAAVTLLLGSWLLRRSLSRAM
ncbi:ABC transporter permease [Ornithinimicrobium pekingense]|uniref:Transport permease YfiM n=1 Tax=Ornithinimicrobium pekingense TaxID=384677 RepID=A0ABQ2F2U9_9MICO|nr:ABC transporter permease [Ornithinimicrobium pekingense]GGK55914.1 putative transport permease YfiM [Ornithinimicrobium pekingense]